MHEAHSVRLWPCRSSTVSPRLLVRWLLALSVVTVSLQLLSLLHSTSEIDSRSGAVHGVRFVSAWHSALHGSSPPAPPPPQDFDAARDGDLGTDFECVGWRETSDCSPDGERDPRRDLPCAANITKDMSGYCEFRHKMAPETTRRVLTIHCDTLRRDVVVQCANASAYLAYGDRTLAYEHDTSVTVAKNQRELLERNGLPIRTALSFDRGVVFSVHEAGLLSAYTSIRWLRARGCELPIELWYSPNETSEFHPIMQELLAMDKVYQREIADPRATRFYTKLHAVFYSAFDNVLLMDTDNFAVQDPTYLFETDEFKATGAVFWPDYWRHNQTIFHIHERNLLWQILGLPFVDMFEQESGQVLIDRRRHTMALNALMYYGFSLPRVYEDLRLLWGDKDLFRLAWMKTNSTFHYIQRPPGSAGRLNLRTRLFCGLSMVQHDPVGEIIFLHRNTMKIDADPINRQLQWTHIQQFRVDMPMDQYDIKRWRHVFRELPKCWGKPTNFARSHTLTPIGEFPFHDIEKTLLAFAADGLTLLEAWMRNNDAHNTRAPPPELEPPP